MYKTVCSILLSLPAMVYGQSVSGLDSPMSNLVSTSTPETTDSTGSSNLETTPNTSGVGMAVSNTSAGVTTIGSKGYMGRYLGGFMQKPDKQAPVGSLAATFTYVASGQIAGHNRSLMGWTVTPNVNFTKYLGVQADFSSLYVRSIYPGQSRFLIAAGPRINLAPRSKFTPFLFAESGYIRRTTKANNGRDWEIVAKGGVGFDYKIVRGFGLQLIPGEYIGQHNYDGSWLHSYSARGGVVFSFFR